MFVAFKNLSMDLSNLLGLGSTASVTWSVYEVCLVPLNFIRCQTQDRCIIISVYVDDIIIMGYDISGIIQVKSSLKKIFDIKDLGPLHYFLGIEVARSCQGISLSTGVFS